MASNHWLILTGEYPPQHGGVSDYTWLVAHALVAAGDTVQVWAPPAAEPEVAAQGVAIHRLPDHFGRGSRAALARAFGQLPADGRVFVQYVPHSFGWKAMNLPFCLWLWTQRKRCRIIVMFHEVAYPWVGHGRFLRHNFLALVNRLMAGFIACSARRIYLSIPAWKNPLWFLAPGRPTEWLPIPSTMPRETDFAEVQTLRSHLLGEVHGASQRQIVGHFGTFGALFTAPLREIVPTLLAAKGETVFLCVGRGSEAFAEELRRQHPASSARILASGTLTPTRVAGHLAACDLLIQPYPDGISSRRTSAMAALALGLPLLTTRGALTEPCWEESGAVRLVDAAREIPAQALALLGDEDELARLRVAGRAFYRARFDLGGTVARLRAAMLAEIS